MPSLSNCARYEGFTSQLTSYWTVKESGLGVEGVTNVGDHVVVYDWLVNVKVVLVRRCCRREADLRVGVNEQLAPSCTQRRNITKYPRIDTVLRIIKLTLFPVPEN